MQYRLTPNGALVFSLSRSEQSEWAEMRRDNGYISIEEIFADSDIPGNSDLTIVQPEDVGALTSSPMFAADVTHDEDGTIMDAGKVWWYPNYQVDDPADRLIDSGTVTFTLGPKD